MSYFRWKFQYVLYGLGANENVIKIHPPTNICTTCCVFSMNEEKLSLRGTYVFKGPMVRENKLKTWQVCSLSFLSATQSPSAYNLKPKYKRYLRTLKAISKN